MTYQGPGMYEYEDGCKVPHRYTWQWCDKTCSQDHLPDVGCVLQLRGVPTQVVLPPEKGTTEYIGLEYAYCKTRNRESRILALKPQQARMLIDLLQKMLDGAVPEALETSDN